ncbi:MAG: HIT family hydrolase, partial [Nitrospirae bacterium]
METLWAPWRMEYILGKKEPECIFCTYPKENKDRDNLILYRSSHNFIVMNKYPYNNGHLMVVPYIHTSATATLSDEALLDFM